MLPETPSFLYMNNLGDKVAGPPLHMLPSKDEIQPSAEDIKNYLTGTWCPCYHVCQGVIHFNSSEHLLLILLTSDTAWLHLFASLPMLWIQCTALYFTKQLFFSLKVTQIWWLMRYHFIRSHFPQIFILNVSVVHYWYSRISKTL